MLPYPFQVAYARLKAAHPWKKTLLKLVQANPLSARTFEFWWVGPPETDSSGNPICPDFLDDDGIDLGVIETCLLERPNVELVVMRGQKPLSGRHVLGGANRLPQIQSSLRNRCPHTHTVHHVNVAEAVRTGTLAVPIAYGGGPVLVNLSVGWDIDLAALRECRVRGLELQTGRGMEFYFFVSPGPRAASYARQIEKPFMRAVIERLAHGSQAQFNFVRREKPELCASSKKRHSLSDEISAELGPWESQDDVKGIWVRADAQLHVITFDELQARVNARVWEQVVGCPSPDLDG